MRSIRAVTTRPGHTHLSIGALLKLEDRLRQIQQATAARRRIIERRARKRGFDVADLLAMACRSRPAAPATLPAVSSRATAPLTPYLDDRAINRLALRAVVRFGPLAPWEGAAAFTRWQEALRQRLPPYAAAEVARRADELRDLLLEEREATGPA